MSISRLIYFSENRLFAGEQTVLQQLSGILKASNKNNQALQVTGALAFNDFWFLQMLEGDRLAIWKTFERIHEDERHGNIVLAEMVEVEGRTFGNWWMGVARLDESKGRLSPPDMSAEQMRALLVDLAKLGLHRDVVDQTKAAQKSVHA